MTTIELTKTDGTRFLYQLDTGWEIIDMGEKNPAHWTNYREARNLDVKETYEEIKIKLSKDNK